MADQFSAYNQSAEEEYIDMYIMSTAIFCYHIFSPNHREFELHPPHKETTISTAEELFYKANLLPHRMKIEEKQFRDSEITISKVSEVNVTLIQLEHQKSWSKRLKGAIGQFLLKMSKACLKKEDEWSYRKSHTSVILRNLINKSVSLSSASSSSFSSVSRRSHVMQRSSSMSSEMESSVMGAIAYCKKLQQIYGRKEECRYNSIYSIVFC